MEATVGHLSHGTTKGKGPPLKPRLHLKTRVTPVLWKEREVLSPMAGMRNPASRVDVLMLSQNSLIKSSNEGLERNKGLSQVTEQVGDHAEIITWVSQHEVQRSVCCST